MRYHLLGLEFEEDMDFFDESSIGISEYVPIFQYLSDKGFQLVGEMAKALFTCYILKEKYCRSMADFWILYEAVYKVVAFSKTVDLWDEKYNMYEGLRERLLKELDDSILWNY